MKRIRTVLPEFLALLIVLAIPSCAPGTKTSPASPEAGEPASDKAVYITEKYPRGEYQRLSLDVSGIARPKGLEEFAVLSHLPPAQQHKSDMCWCFGTVSLLESEIARLGRPAVKLSEAYTVYWEFVEKARRFIVRKGDSLIRGGSEPASALARIKQYGIVRLSDYAGLLETKTEHDHSALFSDYRTYLESLKSSGAWDEAKGIAGVRAILDRYMGTPPDRIDVDGSSLSPLEYLGTLGVDLDAYVSVLSFTHLPFHARGEYRVPDNWWHDEGYYNVPLDEFTAAVPAALKQGFSVVFAADIGEPGNRGDADIAVVPSFDIPRAAIDQSSREFRFANGSSTDDHVVHCVGLKEGGPETWFAVKDSWRTAHQGQVKGYFFYRDDYLKLKVLMIMTHKDAVADLMAKFPPAN